MYNQLDHYERIRGTAAASNRGGDGEGEKRLEKILAVGRYYSATSSHLIDSEVQNRLVLEENMCPTQSLVSIRCLATYPTRIQSTRNEAFSYFAIS
jgi:hypothetical protein